MTFSSAQRNSTIAHQVWGSFDDFIEKDRDSLHLPAKKFSGEPKSHSLKAKKKLYGWGTDRKKLSEIIEARISSFFQEIQVFYSESQWGKPCKNMFRFLADEDPEMLSKIIVFGKLRETLLTFALEELGRSRKSNGNLNILVAFLKHSDSLVREGAVYGLTYYTHSDSAKLVLKQRIAIETSPNVRESIEEALRGI